WAGAEDVPVGQEAVVRRRPHLLDVPLLDQPCGIEASIEVLGKGMVLRRRRAAEVIEGQAKSGVDARLYCMLLLAKGADILSRCRRAELGWCAMLVGGADK